MTNDISISTHTYMPGQLARMASALFFGVVVTAVMFWALQNLINSAESESVSASPNSTLKIDTTKEESRANTPSNTLGVPGRVGQPSVTSSESDEALYLPGVSSSLRKPVYQSDVRPTGGFSLGVGKGNYMPIVKVQQVRPGVYRRIKTLRSNDGHCIVRNPVSRAGAVRDSTVMKGVCEINGKTG